MIYRNAQRKGRPQTCLFDIQQGRSWIKTCTSFKKTVPYIDFNFSLQANLATEVEELKRKAAERQAARQAVEDHQADVSMEPLSAEGIAV